MFNFSGNREGSLNGFRTDRSAKKQAIRRNKKSVQKLNLSSSFEHDGELDICDNSSDASTDSIGKIAIISHSPVINPKLICLAYSNNIQIHLQILHALLLLEVIHNHGPDEEKDI